MDEGALSGRTGQESCGDPEVSRREGRGLEIRCKDHVHHQGSDER